MCAQGITSRPASPDYSCCIEFGWFGRCISLLQSWFERPLHKETKVLAAFKQPIPKGMLVEEGGRVEGGGGEGGGGEGGGGVAVSYMAPLTVVGGDMPILSGFTPPRISLVISFSTFPASIL